MKMYAYTDTQIRTARALLETTETKGYENCKNIVMLRDIIDHSQLVDVADKKEVEDGKEVENKGDR